MHKSIGLPNKKKTNSKIRRTGNIKKRCSKKEGILKSSRVSKIVLILFCISDEIIKKGNVIKLNGNNINAMINRIRYRRGSFELLFDSFSSYIF